MGFGPHLLEWFLVAAGAKQTPIIDDFELKAIWMSGKTWEFNVSPTSTIGELRRGVMFASGGMRKVALLLETTSLDGDRVPLSDFKVQGLDDGAQLTVVVSVELDGSVALRLTDAELTGFVHQVARAGCQNMRSIDLGDCWQVGDEGVQAVAAGCPNLQNITLRGCQRVSHEGLRALRKLGVDWGTSPGWVALPDTLSNRVRTL